MPTTKHQLGRAGAVLALFALSSCAAVDTAQRVYSNTRVAYGAKAAYDDVKDIRDAQPLFNGYGAVVFAADLHPRSKDQSAAIPGAFLESLAYQMQYLVGVSGARLGVCPTVQSCGGRVLSIQFREEAYDANWVEKITVGSALKGKLLFVDAGTNQVISEKRIEGADSYATLLGLIRGMLISTVIKSYPAAANSVDALNRTPAIKPGTETILSAS